MTALQNLDIRGNEISDISDLAGLTSLQDLSLWGNQISDIAVLAGFTNLQTLILKDNQISDISALVANTGLGDGDFVYLYNNLLDTTPGSEDMLNINALEARE